MLLSFSHNGTAYEADCSRAVAISIALQFDGPQPNHFGADPAKRASLRMGDFVGSTEQGGCCNVDTLQLTPHCNGTHTETVSHIVDDDIWIGHAVPELVGLAALITVPVVPAADARDSYRPPLDPKDLIITAANLRSATASLHSARPTALVIRTLPNDASKRSRRYSAAAAPAFFTVEAMHVIVESGVRHLLVDLPSVDRMYDDGLLTNHHLFWNVPEGTHTLTPDCRQDRTITEMIFVPDTLTDGLYLLNLQLPAFSGDAAPSRPVLIPARTMPDRTNA